MLVYLGKRQDNGTDSKKLRRNRILQIQARICANSGKVGNFRKTQRNSVRFVWRLI